MVENGRCVRSIFHFLLNAIGSLFEHLWEERIQKGMTQPTVITYNVPLRRDNLEWPKNNPECKYMQWAKERKVRVKYLPIGETDHSLKKWLIETLPYMDEGWVEDNDWVLSFP